ncbi:hypothetical protein B4U80_01694 [Leptotrombidium deliense]|uniref:Sphingomyelinase D-like protein n=1 Tax=Leptotrombidium deliense TaxID=299467 RepID=A0A443S0U4_9ACAR|nr:hypothetical protein B4U80_01694 [Leptotrombidium deliense]
MTSTSVIFAFFIVIVCIHAKQRPFYNIGHMVNSIKQVNEFLDSGCNALETDITFSSEGIALKTYHGKPCDCLRWCGYSEKIEVYLEYTRNLTTPANKMYRSQYAILLLDLKTNLISKQNLNKAGKLFVDLLYKHLFTFGKSESKLKVVIGVQRIIHNDFVVGFYEEMKKRGIEDISNQIGWQVAENVHIQKIAEMWRRIDVVKNIWLSDGITNCLSSLRSWSRTITMIKMRDECNVQSNSFCARKVYAWTFDAKRYLRNSLRLNVDGIITNLPKNLQEVLREDEFKLKYRLANSDDNPWTIFA